MRWGILFVLPFVFACGGGVSSVSESLDGQGGAAASSTTASAGPGGAGGASATAASSASTTTGTSASTTSTSTTSASSSGAGGDGSGAATTTSGAGGAPPAPCASAADCPGNDGPCSSRVCEGGLCGVLYQPAGAPVADPSPGNCAALACDGAGGLDVAYAADDIEDDGDPCTVDSCSPAGPVHAAEQLDDGLECTIDACGPTEATHTPKAPGTVCSTGLCSAAGACVDHIAVRCSVNGFAYQACDGAFHGWAISYVSNEPGVSKTCNSPPDDVGYCPPGNTCIVFQGLNDPKMGHCL